MTAAVDAPAASCRCGRSKSPGAPYCPACRRRWVRAGRPASGPPAPLSWAEAGRRGNLALAERREAPDALSAEESERDRVAWLAEQDRRRARAIAADRRAAVALSGCVAAGDALGVARLLRKRGTADAQGGLLSALGSLADPVLVLPVLAGDPDRRVRTAAGAAFGLASSRCEKTTRALLRHRAGTWDQFAAVAVVLAAASNRTEGNR